MKPITLLIALLSFTIISKAQIKEPVKRVPAKVVKVDGDSIRLHISHRWFWVRNKYGHKKGDRVWVIVNGEKLEL